MVQTCIVAYIFSGSATAVAFVIVAACRCRYACFLSAWGQLASGLADALRVWDLPTIPCNPDTVIELLKQLYLFTAMPTTQGLKPECHREHEMYMELHSPQNFLWLRPPRLVLGDGCFACPATKCHPLAV